MAALPTEIEVNCPRCGKGIRIPIRIVLRITSMMGTQLTFELDLNAIRTSHDCEAADQSDEVGDG